MQHLAVYISFHCSGIKYSLLNAASRWELILVMHEREKKKSVISFEFKECINETLKIEELFNKFAHNLEIYSVKITVYFMYNIHNSNALLLTDIFSFHKSMFYEQ
jgi:hypothetical protein